MKSELDTKYGKLNMMASKNIDLDLMMILDDVI